MIYRYRWLAVAVCLSSLLAGCRPQQPQPVGWMVTVPREGIACSKQCDADYGSCGNDCSSDDLAACDRRCTEAKREYLTRCPGAQPGIITDFKVAPPKAGAISN